MGIKGLLPVVKPILDPCHVKAFSGRRVGIDASSWLHKGAFSCALDLCRGIHTHKYIDYCLHLVRMLLHYRAIPVLVFDGAPLPMKASTNARRRESRSEARKAATCALERGDRKVAIEMAQRAIEITHEMSRQLIKEVRKLNVEYVVAPYEADAQLAWMATNAVIDLVVTEDSDMIVYGAPQVLYKMTRYGDGTLYRSKKLPVLDDPSFRCMTPDMLMWICVLSGCDFFPGVSGLGIRKAHALVHRMKKLQRVLHAIRFDAKYQTNSAMPTDVHRACLVFRHQVVFDTTTGVQKHLTPLDASARNGLPADVAPHVEGKGDDFAFLGKIHSVDIAPAISRAAVHPVTLRAYEDPLDAVERPVVSTVRGVTGADIPPNYASKRISLFASPRKAGTGDSGNAEMTKSSRLCTPPQKVGRPRTLSPMKSIATSRRFAALYQFSRGKQDLSTKLKAEERGAMRAGHEQHCSESTTPRTTRLGVASTWPPKRSRAARQSSRYGMSTALFTSDLLRDSSRSKTHLQAPVSIRRSGLSAQRTPSTRQPLQVLCPNALPTVLPGSPPSMLPSLTPSPPPSPDAAAYAAFEAVEDELEPLDLAEESAGTCSQPCTAVVGSAVAQIRPESMSAAQRNECTTILARPRLSQRSPAVASALSSRVCE